jgi:hypothetical protein
LVDGIVDAVVKFNTPENKDCQVKVETDTGEDEDDDDSDDDDSVFDDGTERFIFGVNCSGKNVLDGRMILNDVDNDYARLITGDMDIPDGYGSGTFIFKLIEAMARFLGATKTIDVVDDSNILLFKDADKAANKMIRSTVLMTLLSGKLNSYYHAVVKFN